MHVHVRVHVHTRGCGIGLSPGLHHRQVFDHLEYAKTEEEDLGGLVM